MPRPTQCRKIKEEFGVTYFKPRGVPKCSLEEVSLTMDELEAMRLMHLENLYQVDAAQKMLVSRQTLGNILKSANKKITDALVNGKSLKITRGDVIVSERKKKKSDEQCCSKDETSS